MLLLGLLMASVVIDVEVEWFPAWLLVIKPALAGRLGEARVQRATGIACGRVSRGDSAPGT
jgi:hypothetical protein